jgi:hypothetical protein
MGGSAPDDRLDVLVPGGDAGARGPLGHVFSARFACAECGETAATVSLVPPGRPLPWTAADIPDGRGETLTSGADQWRLQISGGPHPMWVWPVRNPLPLPAILDAADLDDLAATDPEYANFRCPTCRAAYCACHWTDVHATTDEGFYDATYGTCPRGHGVLIDD